MTTKQFQFDRRRLPARLRANKHPNTKLRETMEDIRLGRNLSPVFDSVEDAMRSLLDD